MFDTTLFKRKSFDSRALGTLASIFHRCERPVILDLAVLEREQLVRRLHIHVVEDGGPLQLDIDLAPASSKASACTCTQESGLTIGVGGFMCFFVSKGVKTYRCELSDRGGKGVMLDTGNGLEPNDLYSALPTIAGRYVLSTVAGARVSEFDVLESDRKSLSSPLPLLVDVGRDGEVEQKRNQVVVGQPIVFLLKGGGSIRLEPEPEDDDPKRRRELKGKADSARKHNRPMA